MNEKDTNSLGTVYIVGAGVGKKEWITVAGKIALENADIVLYDDLINEDLLEYVSTNAELVYVGKRKNKHSFKQEEINNLILAKAKEYEKVVRLKGGDPFVFGRGFEECLFLEEHNIPYEVIPGLSSCTALPESIGIPVTFRNLAQPFIVITAQTAKDTPLFNNNIQSLADFDGTVIILMGYSRLKEISKKLIEHGKDSNTPAAVISSINGINKWAVGALENIYKVSKEAEISSPAVIVIGQTVSLYDLLN